MNIIIAINEAYIEPAKNMLFSLSCHYREHFNVFLLYSRLSKEKIIHLEEYIQSNCHGKLVSILVDSSLFFNAPKRNWWSEETYYRLISFDVLPKEIDRALWLDADLIINGNIDEFYNCSFDDSYAVVCEGSDQDYKNNLDLPDSYRYFNAGVILFNIAKIREDFNIRSIFNCIQNYSDSLHALDQDVLNILFCQRVKYINAQIYNHETFGNYVLRQDKLDILHNQAKIIHFTGPIKPWNPKGANWADDLWWKYEIKRGRRSAYVWYEIRHLPIRIMYICREYYYILKNKIIRSPNK